MCHEIAVFDAISLESFICSRWILFDSSWRFAGKLSSLLKEGKKEHLRNFTALITCGYIRFRGKAGRRHG